ncbi:para-aminobenzoate synthetase/4-amino-4-deoxychorismate lyase [Comamonas sp. BIGb0152]|uniref:bifunctional anthranilate synthase component I family protein/class IV aminotransferase n=1 Tax=Comamonas sp. BIGb0152 TaxID=2940601 RepID=UPI002167B7B5|nr:bifunctional anthranilate synthase component I family protein/class IV aminotransferase [Comamonas sp. BIGb0152]MCS4295253.1 para-aminobenzoate synthetase/4-amino-4-deoxychorismate lyase [Comamonas sp. BIGb0152]
MPFSARIDMGQPLSGERERLRLNLTGPDRVLEAHDAPSLRALLVAVEQAARAGACCVGGLRYEAATALNPYLPTQAAASGEALAWFAVWDAPGAEAAQPPDAETPAVQVQWRSALTRPQFDAQMARIHADIRNGAYYQINYTQQLQGRSALPGGGDVDGAALFAALQQAQPGGYALHIDKGDEQLLSVSPELFFDWHQPASGAGAILTRPMKGTAARGSTAQQDEAQAQALRASAKERAENVMVVDLLRNDLARIAVLGSVQVPQLFALQALPTVWQMTSDVQARLPQGTGLVDVMQALFPCGSVTGAPKRAAMQAIAELETEARGWYCGALGVVRSDGAGGMRATFNVPIRTVRLRGPQLQCGIGSGITADATADGEWDEWRHKRAFLERASMPFALIETLALDDGVLRHAALHLERMAGAAVHFGYRWDVLAAQAALDALAQSHPQGLWRLRLLLDAQGAFQAEAFACPASPAQVVLQWAPAPLAEAQGEFVRFKTSRRAHYERWTPQDATVFDTLLWNQAGEITETTRGNIAMQIDGRWITPALHCGLLPGVGRRLALEAGQVVEAVVPLSDVPRVEAWAFLNSLRGWIPAQVRGEVPVWPQPAVGI